MGSSKSRKKLRNSPRLKVESDKRRIRFTTSKQKKIYSSTIYDISDTGISFICSLKHAPKIDEVIMLDFAPVNAMKIACHARVVRVELPSKYSNWDHFPETAKVGLEFYNLPKAYKKIIAESMEKAFTHTKNPDYQVIELPHYGGKSWFSQNWQSLLATAALILGTIIASMFILKDVENRAPSSPDWSKNFFEKIKSEK